MNSQKKNVFDVYFYVSSLFFPAFWQPGMEYLPYINEPDSEISNVSRRAVIRVRGFELSPCNTPEPSPVIRTHLSYSFRTLSPMCSKMYFKLLQYDGHFYFCLRKRLFCEVVRGRTGLCGDFLIPEVFTQ